MLIFSSDANPMCPQDGSVLNEKDVSKCHVAPISHILLICKKRSSFHHTQLSEQAPSS